MDSSLGQRITHFRKMAGFSQKDLADAAGISLSALSRYETGKREPNAAAIMSLAKALNVTGDTILGLDPLPDLIAQNSSEALALRIFRTLNDTGQSRVLEYSSVLSKSPQHSRKN